MDPARMKKAPVKASSTPAAEVVDTPPAAPAAEPSAPVLEAQFSEKAAPAPELKAAPISGDLDPVTEAVLKEIPDRPAKKAAAAPAAEPADDQAAPAPRLDPRKLAVPGALALGVLALVVGGRMTGKRPAAPSAPAAPAPVAPAVPSRPAGLVIG